MEPRNPEREARQAAAMRQAMAKFDAEDVAAQARRRSAAPPPPSPQVPAGWYPHPSMVNTQRYWDGASWTDHVAPAAPTAPASPASAVPSIAEMKATSNLETWGWVGAFVFPIVGIVIGIVLLARPGKNSGAWILGISGGWIVLAWMLLSLQTTSTY